MTDVATDVQAEVQTEEFQTDARDYEAEARNHGWTPPDEFKGDQSRFVDAKTFMERADEVMPLLKKKTQQQAAKIDQLERTVKRLAKAEQSAYDNAVADLKARAETAVETGDVDAYRKVDKQLADLQKQANADAPKVTDEAALEAFDAFRDANTWFDKGALASASEVEAEARLYADRLAEKYARQGLPNEMDPADFFAKIAEETEARFPLLKAKKTRDKPPSNVAGVTNGASSRGAKTGANLPAEAKEHAERYMRMGIFKVQTKQEAYDLMAKSYTGPWS